MWRQLYFILPLLLCVTCIRVPVDNVETSTTVTVTEGQGSQNTPIYYITDDAHVDSYLTSPGTLKPDETPATGADSPPTFLVPPSKDKQIDYYLPSERNIQSDWLPMIELQPNNRKVRYQRLPHQSIPIIFNPGPEETVPPVPSAHLEPPAIDAVNEFFLPLPEEVENNDAPEGVPPNPPAAPGDSTLALHLTPPVQKPMNAPTKLYPKKFHIVRPIPIPVSQYAEDIPDPPPKANPAKYFKAPPSAEIEQTPNADKNLYLFQKAEHQRKLKEQEIAKQHQLADAAAEETYGEPTSDEQETSETNLRYPGRNAYSAPIRQAPPPSPPRDAGPAAPAPDGRTEFRMHGMKGPHSYQFGYDTGKGKNRQFRFEERDNDGIVKGHYGYVDRSGKLRVVNYSAHPEYGFRAEEPVGEQP
ncbi:unnamed protein product [Chrysodeixis includens]|uniref:Uncharacterized protein n=1 Tax=Chrysodeixis includens TaxID=689277 RepID=A0A9P0C523_CHRIL|nr:unnamed protein product [Chrysodeixis includens]